jgi:hypothetical protein
MVVVRFPNTDTQDEAVGFLAGRFPAKLLGSGEVIVPEPAVEALAAENFSFTVIGRATYDQMAPVRSNAARPV